MRSNIAVYHQWYDDIQRTMAVSNSAGSAGSSVVNAVTAKVRPAGSSAGSRTAQHPAALRPLLRQEAYWLVDLSAGWRNIAGSGFDLLAYVRNVADKEYKTGGVQLYTGAAGFTTASYGQPRTWCPASLQLLIEET